MRRIKKRVRSKWTEFKKNLRTSFYNALLIVVAVMGTLHYTGWKQDKSIAKEVDRSTPLTEGQVRRLIVDMLRDRIVIQDKDKETEVYSGVRKATFTELDDGDIKVDIPTKGLTFEPASSILVGDGLRLGADVQFAYWKRWGALVGGSMPVEGRRLDRMRGHIGLSYSPYFKWTPNTSFFGGIDSSVEPVFGVRHRF